MTTKAPDMFAIGSPKWPGLSKLAEECGEVLQVIGKLMGTGGETAHWDGTDLRQRLIEEVGDVLAAAEFVGKVNGLGMSIYYRRDDKLQLFNQWHAAGDPAPRDAVLQPTTAENWGPPANPPSAYSAKPSEVGVQMANLRAERDAERIQKEALRLSLEELTGHVSDARQIIGELLDATRPGGGAATFPQLLQMLKAAWQEEAAEDNELREADIDSCNKIVALQESNEQLRQTLTEHEDFILAHGKLVLSLLIDHCSTMRRHGHLQEQLVATSVMARWHALYDQSKIGARPEHTCVNTQMTADGAVPPRCEACQRGHANGEEWAEAPAAASVKKAVQLGFREPGWRPKYAEQVSHKRFGLSRVIETDAAGVLSWVRLRHDATSESYLADIEDLLPTKED